MITIITLQSDLPEKYRGKGPIPPWLILLHAAWQVNMLTA